MKGAGGHHVFMLINDARQIPAATNAVFQATFGRFGYADITKSGAIFPKTIVDRCTPQPERLFFECGAALGPGLVQRRGEPLLVPGSALSTVPKVRKFETWKRGKLWQAMRAAAVPKAARVREGWVAERLASGKVSRAALERAVIYRVLEDDFMIMLANGKRVPIGHLRANLDRYIGQQIPDPLEPDYHDGALCAVIIETGIYSCAHGGARFYFAAECIIDDEF